MGVYLFLATVVVIIAFTVYCVATKSKQQKASSLVSIAAFAVFVLLTLLNIIEWSSRYFAFAALLLLLAAIGTIGLVRKKEDKKAYKAVRLIVKAVGMTALLFISILPAVVFPQHKAIQPTGSYEVASVACTYTDANRIETYTDTNENRKLNVKFYYPQNAIEKYPLVVFSHGAFGIKSSNQSLYNELASNGYVVCSIDHTYQCLYTTDGEGHTALMDSGYMRELKEEDAKTDRKQSFSYYQKWMGIRTGDIHFVLDTILGEAEKKETESVYKLVDPTKIGVMGHSLGGSAALGIGRVREDVSAVIALESPFLCDIQSVENGEFVFNDEHYPIPVLNVYSDSSWGSLTSWPQYAKNAALLKDTGEIAFTIHIKNAGHLDLTDLALTSPFFTRMLNGKKATIDAEDCLKSINKHCLDFFDCYLKGKGEFTFKSVEERIGE